MPGDKLIQRKVNILHFICTVLIVVGLGVLFVCYFSTSSKVENKSKTQQIEPNSISYSDERTKIYEFDLDDNQKQFNSLRFFSSHQLIRAYNDNDLVYEFDKDGGFWASTPGDAYHFVPISEGTKKVYIEITAVYECVENQRFSFVIGNAEDLIYELIRKSLPKFVESVLMLVLAVGILIYYIFMKRKQNLTEEMLYLALFSIILGMWSMNETDMSSIMSVNRIFETVVPYICMMLIVPTFVMFIYNYLGIADKFVHKLILSISIVEFVVLNVLHYLKIAEYRETLFIVQITLLISAIYLFCAVLIKVIHRQYSRRLQICIIGLGLFAFAMLSDLITYYRALGDADIFGRYVYLAFVGLLTWDLIDGTNDIIAKGRKARELEVFAITDSMTGVFNRNAFEMHMARPTEEKDVTVIVADLNDLKIANDTYGHDVGDEYIIEVAEIISDVCSKSGNCYRTGGDEFCVLMPKVSPGALDRMIRSINTRVQSLNHKSAYDFDFEVAIGTARYDEFVDFDMYALVKRADMAMYENKKYLKQKRAQSATGRR